MKTIRKEVFETNSSSTHSITIGVKITPENPNIEPLVEKSILYPARLIQRQTSLNLGYDDLTTTICSTKDEKAALIINWLHYLYVEEEISYDDYLTKKNQIRDICEYYSIDSDIDADYCPYDSNGNIFDEYSFEELLEFIIDPEMKIMDQTIPH